MRTVGYYMGERVQVLADPHTELLHILGDGLTDEEDGTVDSYGGHLARVGASLLLTDSDGNRHAYLALAVPQNRGQLRPEGASDVMVAHLIMAKHRRYREQAETSCVTGSTHPDCVGDTDLCPDNGCKRCQGPDFDNMIRGRIRR